MSRVITALACLAHAAYLEAAPTPTAHDGWLAAAHDARREWDVLCDERDALQAQLAESVAACNAFAARVAELERELDNERADRRTEGP